MLTPEGYINRIVDKQLDEMLEIYGAVCVEGPKWCGKTWASRNHAVSASFIGDPTGNFMNKQLAEMDPLLVLEGELPRLIDEWQEVPSIWDAVKYRVDVDNKKGEYVLTGSSSPRWKGILHSGSGRIGNIRMRTMSLFESGDSTGDVSLSDLFSDVSIAKNTGEVSLKKLIEFIVRGGWPGSRDLSLDQAMRIPVDYLENVPGDMEKVDGKKRDVRKVKALLKALGRAESNMTAKKSLQKDIEEFSEDIDTIGTDTITEYLDSFEKLFLVENQPAFDNKLRSSIKALKKPKRHFTDPSLAVAAIGATPQTLMQDLNTLGYLFEALCVRDLRVYAEYNRAKVYHYHDERDNEADIVVEMPNGKWGMFEVKMGFNQIEAAANQLISLKENFESETSNSPAFVCVICGMTSAAFRRPDGVYVVPITALRP